jgi:predicted PolB exonuclease-like 3'-5' exonuclease
MTAWAGWGGRISLDALCKALDIPTKGTELDGEDIDGSKVWDFVQAGRVSDVATYCMADVERVRTVYKRMNFVGMTEASQQAA